MDRETLFNLIPAYALGALDPEERAAFERALAADPEAQQRLAEYQAVAEALPLAAPARLAPAHLQADLRHRLAAARSRRRFAPAWRLPVNGWAPVAVGVATALMVMAAAVLLLLQPQDDAGAQLYARIAAQPDARRVALTPAMPDVTGGELLMTADEQQAVIRVDRLPVLGEEQTFQLWLVDAAGARSGGLFRYDRAAGPFYIIVPLEKPASAYEAFGVSLEPAGGSPLADGPSGPRVFRVNLTG